MPIASKTNEMNSRGLATVAPALGNHSASLNDDAPMWQNRTTIVVRLMSNDSVSLVRHRGDHSLILDEIDMSVERASTVSSIVTAEEEDEDYPFYASGSLLKNAPPLGSSASSELDVGGGESSIVTLLYLSYMPLCCLVGLTGNCMVWILIRSNRIFKRLPSSAYLLTLSLMSNIFLLSLLSFWIEEGFIKGPTERHSMVLCKCATFLAHFCDFASVWLIVCVGFERLTLLYRVSFRRSLVNAQRHVVCLLVASALANMWILFIAEINAYGGCDIKPHYEHVYNMFSLVETIICMIIPSVFIILSNVFVVLKLRFHMKQIPSSPSVSFNTADTVYSSAAAVGGHSLRTIRSTKVSKATLYRMSSRLSASCRAADTVALKPSVAASLQQQNNHAHYMKRNSLRYTDLQLTRSLLVVTTVFIVLNLPNYLYRIGIQFLRINEQTDLMQRLSFMAHVLLYTHHACLFYLYIFNSPQMRKRLLPTALKFLECYCLKPSYSDYSDHHNGGGAPHY